MERLHPTVRWVLMVPASIIGALAMPFLFGVFTPRYLAEGLIFQCFQSIMTAVGFVGVGAYTAPRSRRVVAWIFAGLFSLLCAMAIGMILVAPYGIDMPPTRAIIMCLAGIGGAIYVAFQGKALNDN